MHIKKTKTSVLVLYLELMFYKMYKQMRLWHNAANKKRISRLMKLDGKTLEERYDTSHEELMDFYDRSLSETDEIDEYIYNLGKRIKYACKH